VFEMRAPLGERVADGDRAAADVELFEVRPQGLTTLRVCAANASLIFDEVNGGPVEAGRSRALLRGGTADCP